MLVFIGLFLHDYMKEREINILEEKLLCPFLPAKNKIVEVNNTMITTSCAKQ